MSMIQRGVPETGLNSHQVLKASLALVRRLEELRDAHEVDKPSLLVDDDEENANSDLDVPLWLIVTAKSHIATSNSLKPGKVTVPHVLYSNPNTKVCLITADPPANNQSAYKDAVADPAFPKDVRRTLSKVIAYSKLAKRYKSFESRRQLMSEYDVFLADERIIKLLPVALGKTFYKSRTKRPIPVCLTGKENWEKKIKKDALERLKSKPKRSANDGPDMIGKPVDMASDIEKALSIVAIHLSPSFSTAIKVAYAAWPAEWIAANVEVVVQRVVEKYIPSNWSGVKSIHLKGPETASLPIYLSEEDWVDENDILDEGEPDAVVLYEKRSKEEKKDRKRQKKLERKQAEEDEDMELVEEIAAIEMAGPVQEANVTKKRKRPEAQEVEIQDDHEPQRVSERKKGRAKAVEPTSADDKPSKRRRKVEIVEVEEDPVPVQAKKTNPKGKAKADNKKPTTRTKAKGKGKAK